MKILRDSGFTLVELALVLVIVGLLVGAIVKGWALLQNARAKRVLDDIKNLEVIAWGFYDRYARFPGDCNGDGIIGVNVSGTWTVTNYNDAPSLSLCTPSVSENDPDIPVLELKAARFLSSSASNAELMRHAFGGAFFIGRAQPAGHTNWYNAVFINDVPCWVAKMIDEAIDGDGDINKGAGIGRIRFYYNYNDVANAEGYPNAPWNLWEPTYCHGNENTIIDIVYLFDLESHW